MQEFQNHLRLTYVTLPQVLAHRCIPKPPINFCLLKNSEKYRNLSRNVAAMLLSAAKPKFEYKLEEMERKRVKKESANPLACLSALNNCTKYKESYQKTTKKRAKNRKIKVLFVVGASWKCEKS